VVNKNQQFGFTNNIYPIEREREREKEREKERTVREIHLPFN
jgi:hypothetical protein